MAVHLIDVSNDLLGMTVLKSCHCEQRFFFQQINQMHKVERNQEEHADF